MSDSKTPMGFHDDGSFRFHVPFDLKKGSDGKTWIEGIASVEKEDITGETVILKGMDLSYLLNRGYFNDNHSKTTDGKVGVPTEAAVTPEGLRVKGYMLDTPRAQGIIDLAESLHKSGSSRRLGFSVEGKTLKRDGKIVQRSWIKDIAITAEPVNPYTYMDVVKSISADIEANGYCEGDCEQIQEERPEPVLSYWDRMEQVFSRCLSKIFRTNNTAPLEKTMEAGHQNPPQSGGSVLRSESLEDDLHNLDIPQGEVRQLTKSEAVEILKRRGYSETAAKRAVGVIFDSKIRKFMADAVL